MTHRIYKAICTVAVVVFLCSLALIMELLYNYFSAVHLKQMKELAGMTARGVELNGNSFFDDFSFDGCRITWIQSDGEVLFDNEANADHMENHLEREEVREAMTTGEGESSRYSKTLTERYVYVATALDDGSVIRIADTQYSVLTLLLGSMQPILIVLAIGLGLSFYLAWKLSKRIVKPLNEMDLDHPDEKLVYEELAPLVKRLNSQQRQISIQRSDLQRKRDEFEAATSHMSEGIILLDETGSILSINASARRILKATPYCVGKDILLFNNTYELQDILQRARNGEHVEKPFATDAGSYQINVSPIFSGETVTGTVLLIFDITEKEKAEQMRREFTANVSHELKTPLHTIAGYAELLANNAVKPEDIPSFSQQILADARRMSALVDDIIRLSHLDEGSGNMEQEDVNLMQIAREVVDGLQPFAAELDVSLTLTGESALMNGIAQSLNLMIQNLCDNAIKYNRKGGSVNVVIQNNDDEILLTVSDTGIGIAPELQDRVFERFYRVDKGRSREMGGTGLGLSIVKHAAMQHNAQIDLNSRPNEGTTITIRFPKIKEIV